MDNFTKPLVKKILENAGQYEWSLQGLGMLRLYLSREFRLHVWDSRFAVPNVSRLHTHPWDFKSTLVAGRLINTIYTASDIYGAVWYRQQGLKCGPGGCIVGSSTGIKLRNMEPLVYLSGQEYFQTSDQIHDTNAEDGTVTIVHRTRFNEDPDKAYVFWPEGQPWISAEPRQATGLEVKQITQTAIERWF